MVGVDHGPAESAEERSPELQARHARLGLALFGVYFALYVLFILLAAFDLSKLAASVAAGINLALVYGFGLIAAAIVLALLYGWLCRTPASSAGREEQP